MNIVTRDVKYYAKQINKLYLSLPYGLYDLLRKYNGVIAGGAVLSVFSGDTISDFDVYFHNDTDMKSFTEKLSKRKDCKTLVETDNAITYEVDDKVVQVVTKLLEDGNTVLTTEEIVKNFDFTCCMAAVDYGTLTVVHYEHVLEDVALRRLVINPNGKYPVCTLVRTIKYQEKGYTFAPSEAVKLALMLCNLQMNSYADLKEQLQGIDTQIFEELTDDLISNHSEKQKIDYGHVMNVIDEKLNSVII